MATLTKGYAFVSGETNVTHTKLNNLVDLATISAIATADISDDAITKDKINSNVAGSGLAQNADGSLEVKTFGNLTTALTNANKTLTPGTSLTTQKYTGTLSGPVVINLSRTNAVAGDKFRLVLNVVVDGTNTLTIQENGSGALVVFQDANFPTVRGTIDFEYMTGSTSWEITLQMTQES
jgi:hypothetical protein